LKKGIAICILAIMLFNSVGYQVLSHFLQERATQQVQAQIDAGSYEPTALLELSVSMNLPYTTDWTDWEKMEGDVQIDGIHYRYVERKLADGRMYVRCLPNTPKQTVLNARDAFFKMAYDANKQTENKKSSGVFVSNYIGDYDDACQQLSFKCPAALHFTTTAFVAVSLTAPLLEGPMMPPDLSV
jgi:hypothetical protein